MFLHRFVRPPPPSPPVADFCSHNNLWTTFWIYFIFWMIVCLHLQITWLDFGRFSLWHWPWIFKVKWEICYISANRGPIATKRKANKLIELQASNVTNGFDLDHDLDFWILNVRFDLWSHAWTWPWIFMVKFWNSCISEWEATDIAQRGGSRSFITIWWPRTGVDLPDSDLGDFSCRHAVDSYSLCRVFHFFISPIQFKTFFCNNEQILNKLDSMWHAPWPENSSRVPAMAWSRQTAGHFLSWCWSQHIIYNLPGTKS